MDPLDFSALFSSDEDAARQQRTALADALRQRRAAGTLGTILGGPFAASGKQFAGEANEYQNALQQAAQFQGLHGEALRQQAEARNPASTQSTIGRQLAGQLGLEVPEGTPYSGYESLLPEATKAASIPKFSPIRDMFGNTTGVLNTRTGQVMRMGGGGGGGGHGMFGSAGLTPEARDMLARQAATTGVIPRLGSGMVAGALGASIANRAAELQQPEGGLAGSAASYKANTTSLAALQKQADFVNSFERTGLANLELFLNQAHKVVDTGSPLFNAPARSFAQRVAGDPNMTGFITARQVAVQEIAKILSGNMGNMALSDSARKEASDLLTPDASLAQIERAANVLRTDLANRKAGFAAQLGEIRSRLGTQPGQPPMPAAHSEQSPAAEPARISSDAEYDALPSGTLFIGPDGKRRRKR